MRAGAWKWRTLLPAGFMSLRCVDCSGSMVGRWMERKKCVSVIRDERGGAGGALTWLQSFRKHVKTAILLTRIT